MSMDNWEHLPLTFPGQNGSPTLHGVELWDLNQGTDPFTEKKKSIELFKWKYNLQFLISTINY